MRAVRFHAARDIRVEDVAPPSDALAPDEVLHDPAGNHLTIVVRA